MNYANPLKEMIRKYEVQDLAVLEMEHSGYRAALKAAPRLKDDGQRHGLPPGDSMPIFPIHSLPGCPENWVRDAGTFVVPVISEIGLWFDWTMNDPFYTSVVPSVKGMNPITGQKMEGCQMEQYRDKCPVHGDSFANGNYCEKCGYKWAPQNYVNGIGQQLWWDGFAQPDGTVRQFFYTEDVARDIASLAIGKENTMPAFGFAFFRYKKDKPPEPQITHRYLDISPLYKSKSYIYSSKIRNTGSTGWSSGAETKGCSAPCGSFEGEQVMDCLDMDEGAIVDNSVLYTQCCAPGACAADIVETRLANNDSSKSDLPHFYSPVSTPIDWKIPENASRSIAKRAMLKKLEVSVGAGAIIDQGLKIDMRPLEDYHEKPQAMIRLYFVFENEFAEIVAKGAKSLQGSKQGYLARMPVG
jgi:hypothetical protein